MDAQTELHGAALSARIDSDAELRYFGQAPLEEIRRELKHYGVAVEGTTASLRTYLARRIAEFAPPCNGSRRDHAEARYLEELRSIQRIAAFVARRSHLSADEAEEFTADVLVRLFENDYAIIRKFDGHQTFTTYLTSVILGLLHRHRVAQWGKWRPSAEAKRLGDKAITLERLLTRDGFSFAEAVNILTTQIPPSSLLELKAIYVRLPLRNPHPRLVSDDICPDFPTMDSADDRVQERDRERNARAAAAALDAAIEQISSEDRTILQLRFWRGMTVVDIARILHIEPRKLYKRLEKLFAVLRRSLENAGIDRGMVDDLLRNPAYDFPLESMPERMQTASDGKRPD